MAEFTTLYPLETYTGGVFVSTASLYESRIEPWYRVIRACARRREEDTARHVVLFHAQRLAIDPGLRKTGDAYDVFRHFEGGYDHLLPLPLRNQRVHLTPSQLIAHAVLVIQNTQARQDRGEMKNPGLAHGFTPCMRALGNLTVPRAVIAQGDPPTEKLAWDIMTGRQATQIPLCLTPKPVPEYVAGLASDDPVLLVSGDPAHFNNLPPNVYPAFSRPGHRLPDGDNRLRLGSLGELVALA